MTEINEFSLFTNASKLIKIEKILLRDVLPDLEASSSWTTGKPEVLAAVADGNFYIVTNDDAMDDMLGETPFLK